MQTILQQAAAAQSATGLSGRRLCSRLGLARATYCRWSRRQRCGQPLLQSPGPAKTGPLPLAEVREKIQALEHGASRTRGTGELYEQYHDVLSRRQLADLVRQERQKQQRERREQLRRINWYSTQTAWAMDATEWKTNQPGVKLEILAVRDLASNYGLGFGVCQPLIGEKVAHLLAQLIRRHGPPLFLKRDNGTVLHTEAVENVLAEACVLPLDSPVRYPRYNGGMEKQIGDLKHLFPFDLPLPPGGEARAVQPFLEAIRHEFNARPRPGLEDCSPAEMYHCGPRLQVDRRTRAAIFDWIWEQAQARLSSMKRIDHRSAAAAWRHSAETWLRCQALITVTENHENLTDKNILLPLFS